MKRPPAIASPLPLALVTLFIAAVVSVTLAFFAARQTGKQAVAEQMEKLEEAGVPASMEALGQRYHDAGLPADENAAPVFEQAFERLDVERGEISELTYWRSEDRVPGEPPFSGEEMESVAALLDRNSEALRLFEEASHYSYSRFPIDFSEGPDTKFPHLPSLRDGVGLLGLQAGWQVQQGEVRAAAATVETLFRTGKLLFMELPLRSHLTHISVHYTGVRVLEYLLSMETLKEDQLIRFQELLEVADRQTIRPALNGEIVFGNATFMEWAGDPGSAHDEALVSFLFHLYVRSGRVYRDQLYFLEQLENLLVADEIGEQLRRAGAIEEFNFNFLEAGTLSRLFFLPYVERAVRSKAASHAALRMMGIAVACERFRLDRGEFPERLDDLVPAYIEELPVDPFTETPFKMRHENGGIRLESGAMAAREPDQDPLSVQLWRTRVNHE